MDFTPDYSMGIVNKTFIKRFSEKLFRVKIKERTIRLLCNRKGLIFKLF